MNDEPPVHDILDTLGAAKACAERALAAKHDRVIRRVFAHCAWEALERAALQSAHADLDVAGRAAVAEDRAVVEDLLWRLGRPQ